MPRMPRPRKPYIQREKTRHDKTVWYFRRGKEKRVRLPGIYDSPEFRAAYDAALAGKEPPKRTTAPKSSLRWLVDQYLTSGRFSLLSPETQEMRRRILLDVCKTGGNLDFRNITDKEIRAGKMRREATPAAAHNYVRMMRAVFSFAVDSDWISVNPALAVKTVEPKTDGHHTWTVDEVRQYQATHPIGTQARLALDIMLYTGFRRGDAVKFGRQHVKDGTITYRSTKNGVEIILPLLSTLRRSIEATPAGRDLAYLCTSKGRAWSKEAFGGWFAEQCAAAGVVGRAHGLRKAGATFAAENGANELQLAAMYGWKNPRMAEIYVKKASRKRLAEQAANALSPHLGSGAGADANSSIKSTVEK